VQNSDAGRTEPTLARFDHALINICEPLRGIGLIVQHRGYAARV